jgi:pyrroline-5-carboxylate reductase
MRVVVIGGGVMGRALIAGFADLDPAPEVTVVEKDAAKAADLQAAGFAIVDLDALVDADVVLIAVKPQDVGALVSQVGASIPPSAVVISIAAGVSTGALESHIAAAGGSARSIVRVMPNTPARIGAGVLGVSAGAACPESAVATAVRLMETAGVVVTIPEEHQEALTAVSGSGPAYVFYLAEKLIESARAHGLSEEVASTIVRQTVLGSALLYAESGESPEVLRRNVTSPGGTTAAAIAVFEDRALAAIVHDALAANITRSGELSL